ncbi:carbonic anhydrase 4-like [Culex pipiens pallens]|uniref:carbonic anhydrase 4-like n=1 Tax=Culex pipiens pallens TaxID=42434 RepID=UPI001954F53B|nr:carbonic anhydrase 4-like [Culex pipiens pallens]
MMSVATALLLLSAVGTLAADWRYPTPGPDGSVGSPENWGGSCDQGRRQSPIDIAYAASVRGSYPEFIFDSYDSLPDSAYIVNNGHTVQINLDSSASSSVYGGGFRSKYVLEQLHFHWSSEHTIEDRRYALEMHLVHRQSRYASVEQASSHKAGIAVLAVLFHVDEHPNEAIQLILNSTSPIKAKVDDKQPLRGSLHLKDLLPKDRTVYFRYEGSLTTPVCAESVVWTVFPESLPISLGQVQDFMTIHDADNRELVVNYRPVQPLNTRVLVLVSDTEVEASGARRIASGMFAAVLLSLAISLF